MRGRDGGGRQIFQREIARRNRVQRIAHRPGEAQRLGCHVAVDGKRGARQRRRAQRRFIQPLARIREAAAVAAEHLDIGQQVMAEGHRLGRLHMGEARHDGAGMLLGLREQRPLQRQQALIGALAGGAHPEAEIGRHLVVARAGGVQPPGRRADQLGQPRLDVEMDVFQFALEDELALGDFLFDLLQALQDGLASSLEMMPSVASMRACAFEPARSSTARRLSKSMEGVISSMIAAGPASNRPPHILLVLIVSGNPDHDQAWQKPYRPAARWPWAFYMGSGLLLSTTGPAMPSPAGRRKTPAKAAPAVAFADARRPPCAGSDFQGHYVLLNMWATWCAPCVAELPALTRLKAAVPGLTVLAVDLDRPRGPPSPPFPQEPQCRRAGRPCRYRHALMRAFGAAVLPTTVLIDPKGNVIARAEGPAECATRAAHILGRRAFYHVHPVLRVAATLAPYRVGTGCSPR